MPPGKGAVPQKYIRTFASDLKALQESNPDAIPAGTTLPAAAAPLPAAAAPLPVPQPASPKPDVKLPPANIIAPQSAAVPIAVVPEPISEEPSMPEPLPVPPPVPNLAIEAPPQPPQISFQEPKPVVLPQLELEPKPILAPEPLPAPSAEPKPSPLQTYAGDFNTLVKEKNATTATILAAEGDRAEKAPVLWKQRPDRATIWYVAAGIALLVVGGIAALYFYGEYLAKTSPVVLAPAVSAPIFVDDRQELSGSGAALLAGITQSVGNSLGQTGVRLLYTPESLSGTSTVFSALDLSAPGAVVRNIAQTSGMAGVINVNGAQSPFFILSVSSYADTFAGMLAWEPTMPQDLAALFPPYPAPAIATSTATTTATAAHASVQKGKTPSKTATTTPPTPPPPAPGFYDDTIANHDVREYRDSENRIVFLYGYWDQATLILARDAAAFTEIENRLATSRTN